ncbi:MAG: manA, partial [Ilumatobacteraceae bacterium]|nr:manA [Ilumatobacteraceae bacterium]
MGASDNVIRGGLTPKHVDVPELLNVLKIEPLDDPVTVPTELEPDRWCYDTPDTPFRLWRWDLDGTITHTSTGREMLLCTDGSTSDLGAGEVAYLSPDETVTLDGAATIWRVEECKLASSESEDT